MKKHRDSVEYWKKVTDVDSTLSKHHSAPQDLVIQYYLDKLNLTAKEKVLDVGTGFGRLIPKLEKYGVEIFAVDSDEKMVVSAKSANTHCDDRILLENAESLSFPDNEFDVLICWGVFEELSQKECLAEFNRVTKVGGRLLITGKNYLYCKDDELALKAEQSAREKSHPNEFTRCDQATFKDYGFDIAGGWYFLRRGDFAKNKYIEDVPERFYEYVLILEKIRKPDTNKMDTRCISNAYSRTWLEKSIDRDLSTVHFPLADQAPILLSGVYRSGTTILAQIVGSHPDIFMTYDSVKYLRFSLSQDVTVTDPKSILSDIGARLNKRWKMQFDSSEVYRNLRQSNIHSTIYYESLSHLRDCYKPGARLVGEKNAVIWSQIPQFLDMFPEGKVIHIFRDPRDVVASYKNMTYEPGYAYIDAVFNCVHAWDSLEALYKYYGPGQIMSIRLEDLLEFPSETTIKICDFLGVEYVEDMLDQSNYKDKAGMPWKHNSAFDFGESSLRSTSKRWQEYLTESEILFIEMIANRHMVRNGYGMLGSTLNYECWNNISHILQDSFIFDRFSHWLTTGKGVEGYPSDPLSKELLDTNRSSYDR